MFIQWCGLFRYRTLKQWIITEKFIIISFNWYPPDRQNMTWSPRMNFASLVSSLSHYRWIMTQIVDPFIPMQLMSPYPLSDPYWFHKNDSNLSIGIQIQSVITWFHSLTIMFCVSRNKLCNASIQINYYVYRIMIFIYC